MPHPEQEHDRPASGAPSRSDALAALASYYAPERLAAMARRYGMDIGDRRQVLDAAAVGLTVLLWRNTELEDVHAGRGFAAASRARIAAAGVDPDSSAAKPLWEEVDAQRASLRALLRADLDGYRPVADPQEASRIARLVTQRAEHEVGIPDDVMMRANADTARQVRRVLAATLPVDACEPGVALPVVADDPDWAAIAEDEDGEVDPELAGAPVFLLEVHQLLADPDRSLVLGGAVITVGGLLGESAFEAYVDSMDAKMSRPLLFAAALGGQGLLGALALTGLAYAADWWPSPHWAAGVGFLRQAWSEGRDADVHRSNGAALPWLDGLRGDTAVPEDLRGEADEFWSALRSRPYRLGGHQAEWVISSELETHLRAAISVQAGRLGADEDDHVSPLAMLF